MPYSDEEFQQIQLVSKHIFEIYGFTKMCWLFASRFRHDRSKFSTVTFPVFNVERWCNRTDKRVIWSYEV